MTSTFTPYVDGSHPARRKAEAARALLAVSPPGTEIVYVTAPKADQNKVSATVTAVARSQASRALNVQGFTRADGDTVYGILYRRARHFTHSHFAQGGLVTQTTSESPSKYIVFNANPNRTQVTTTTTTNPLVTVTTATPSPSAKSLSHKPFSTASLDAVIESARKKLTETPGRSVRTVSTTVLTAKYTSTPEKNAKRVYNRAVQLNKRLRHLGVTDFTFKARRTASVIRLDAIRTSA